MKLNEIYVGNCFELVNQIKDNSIDLIVCDGPYGVTDFEWDKISDIRDFNLKVIETFSRVLKPGGALYLFGKRMPINPSDCEKS